MQELLKKVSVRPSLEYTKLYPLRMPAKITVNLLDGTAIEHEMQDYPGFPSHPFSWEDSIEKFDRLVTGCADDTLCQESKTLCVRLKAFRSKI